MKYPDKVIGIRNVKLISKRVEYGKQVVKNIAVALIEKYGKGWSFYKLQHCVRSAYTIDMDAPAKQEIKNTILKE